MAQRVDRITEGCIADRRSDTVLVRRPKIIEPGAADMVGLVAHVKEKVTYLN
jgi:hypothetical protein